MCPKSLGDFGRHSNMGVRAPYDVTWAAALLTPYPGHAGLQGMMT